MNTIALSNPYKKTMFWLIITSIICASVFYMYFVNETVRSVVARQSFEKQITHLNSNIANLQFEYISHAHSVDMVLATSMGFKEVREPTYIARKEALSLRGRGE